MGAQAVRLSNVDIDNALKDRDFEVLFQPIFDLGNGALARVETFIRWRHPSLGVLPPGAFISFFETQGRMSELTRYVLEEALSAYQGWRGAFAPGFSINLALSDLSDESFPSHFMVLLRDRGFPAELVTLECPMPPVDADVEATSRQLQRLSETGARLAIEVRGRANDFLKTIRPFPFAEIKTGGAAILRFARTVRGPGLSAISELLELAAEQNAAITAVGVEDQASLSALRGLGFAAAQGNHLGRVGALAQFMPSHVNDVRALLGLEALSSDDLAALFRTGGPRLSPAMAQAQEPVVPEAPQEQAEPSFAEPLTNEDALIERLAARIARAGTPKAAPPGADAARAAAIARARRKTVARERIAARNALKEKAEARPEAAAPRDMQELLSREFEAFSDDAPRTDEFGVEGDAAVDPAPPSAESRAAAAAEVATATPASETSDTKMPTETHMTVPEATARFTPTIRVSGPAPARDFAGEAVGDLEKIEPLEPGAAAAPESEAAEVEIPPVKAGFFEETVAVATEARPEKSFLTRTIIPWSALRIRHFWPRFIRRRMKKR